jgi:hypothetical protein
MMFYLTHGWHRELRTFTDTSRRPALGDGFALGIEAYRVWAIGMQVTKQ